MRVLLFFQRAGVAFLLVDCPPQGDQKFALGGGGGGGSGAPGWGGGSENGLPSPRANFVWFYPTLMVLFLPPLVYQNDQRIMGIVLRYACWGIPPPPAPSQTPPPKA